MAEFKTQGSSADSLNQLMQLIQLSEQRKDRELTRLTNRQTLINNQLNNANTSSELANLQPLIDEFNQDSTRAGYEELSMKNTYADRNEAFGKADIAYEKAKSILDENLGDEDMLYNNIMGMTWGETTNAINDLENLKDAITNAGEYKYKYNANGRYTQTGLLNAVNQRIGQLGNKMDILKDNQGAFLVYGKDGKMDEEAQKIYDSLQFRVLSGDRTYFEGKNSGYDQNVTTIASKYVSEETEYKKWRGILDKNFEVIIGEGGKLTAGKKKQEIDEDSLAALVKTGFDMGNLKDDAYTSEFILNQMDIAKEAGDKYNRQHQVLTGQWYEEKTAWGTSKILGENIPGMKTGNGASSTGSGAKTQEQLDKEFAEGAVSETTIEAEEEARIDREFEAGAVTEFGSEDIDAELDNIHNKTDDSEGIDEEGIGGSLKQIAVVGTGWAALNNKDRIVKIGKIMHSGVIKGSSWLKSSFNLSGDQINQFYSDKTVNKTMKNIKNLEKDLTKYNDELKKTEDLKKKTKAPKKRRKITKRLKRLKELIKDQNGKIKQTKTNFIESWANKWKKDPKDIARLFKSKNASKWNIFKLRDTLQNKFPRAAGQLFSEGVKGKVTGTLLKGGLGWGQFRLGQGVAEATGIKKVQRAVLGEGFLAETAGDIAGTAATHQAVKQVTKRFLPQLGKMLLSESGKKYLIKKLGKKAVTKIGTSIAAGGGIASLITGLVGLGLTGYDIYKAVKNYEEE